MSLLTPRKVKHRKTMRGKQRGTATQKLKINFGSYGLKAMSGALITARQIESARRAITRYVQKGGKIWIRIFPDKAVSKKGSEVKMGGGKGAIDHYAAVVRPGNIIFEIDGIEEDMAKQAFRLASYKLPIKTKFIVK
ncbi:50S ribosomal protein L16 [Patescibacteria group bacterium]|nr:50S ribosomal protein L16 [Patescibacteria group bacterium]MBU1890338.1 50S ribosomal protein L16 [Patescibacteria group bacterium]